jgi:O-antigen ligase
MGKRYRLPQYVNKPIATRDMPNKHNPSIYIVLFLALSVISWILVMIAPGFMDVKVIVSTALLLLVLLFCHFDTRYLLLSMIVLMPALAGLEKYQIDITPFIAIVGIDQYYQIDLFFIARVVLLGIALIEILRKGKDIFFVPMAGIILFSVLLNVLPFANSDFKILGLAYYWFHLVAAFGAYFLGYYLFSSKKAYLWLISAIIISSIIPIIVSVKQLLLQDFFYENDSTLPRILATFWHPNRYGSYLFVLMTVYLVSFFAVRIQRKNARAELLPWVPFLTFGFFLAATFSRTSWVALAISVAIVAIFKKQVRLPAFYFGSLAIMVSLMIDKTRNRIVGMFVRQYNDTLSGRMETWDIALYKFQQSPWIGYGPGSFNEVIKVVRGTDVGNFAPHSDMVRFVLEGGIMGILAYFFYMAAALWHSFKSFWEYRQGSEQIALWGKTLIVDYRLLGIIPFLLFVVMIPMSMLETPTLDFIHQFYAWILLGSWLGLNHTKK